MSRLPNVAEFRNPLVKVHRQQGLGLVLHVITDTSRRGAQVFATDLCAHLDERGKPGLVVALAKGGAGAQLKVPVLGRGARDFATLRALRRAMAQATVVVAHGSSTLLACTIAGIGLPVPLIYRNISDPAYWLHTVRRRARVRLMLSRVDRVVALWPGGADYLVNHLGLDRRRISVIPNSVRMQDFRPPNESERQLARQRFGLPDDVPVVLYVAALQPEKHPDTAVRALARLPRDTYLLMLGDGSERRAVADLAQRIAPDRVVMAGQIDDPVQGYWAADVIVLPSEGEGLPAVLIEAALCCLPAVASKSGGNADIVLDGVTGFVVDPADPNQLADGVGRTLAQRMEMGDSAREHCRLRYDMSTVAEQWELAMASV